MKNYKWPLMSNNILANDKKVLVNFINRSNQFTNGPKVKEFEENCKDYFGVEYAITVNSWTAGLITAFSSHDKLITMLSPPFPNNRLSVNTDS